MDENLKKIKEIILQTAKEMNVEIDKIILFGSRARGDYREDSDYDILIVTKNDLEKEKKEKFLSTIEVELIKLLEVPIDLILIDKKSYEEDSKYVGYLYYWVEKEGVVL
ncbi:MAG: nucleotidyltransferase domain-containing protein [Candidatus Aenigmatarchaeota archaeon]